MKLEEAMKINPYNPKKGNKAAYARYLRYIVDDFYNLKSKEVQKIVFEEMNKNGECKD